MLILLDLVQELVEALLSLATLDLIQTLTVLLWHAYFHLGERALLFHVSSENLLLCIHVIIAIEVDCLRPSCCVTQVLLHFFNFELFMFLWG